MNNELVKIGASTWVRPSNVVRINVEANTTKATLRDRLKGAEQDEATVTITFADDECLTWGLNAVGWTKERATKWAEEVAASVGIVNSATNETKE